jgi:hypothetical protein
MDRFCLATLTGVPTAASGELVALFTGARSLDDPHPHVVRERIKDITMTDKNGVDLQLYILVSLQSLFVCANRQGREIWLTLSHSTLTKAIPNARDLPVEHLTNVRMLARLPEFVVGFAYFMPSLKPNNNMKWPLGLNSYMDMNLDAQPSPPSPKSGSKGLAYPP